jgi:hypothetical protein
VQRLCNNYFVDELFIATFSSLVNLLREMSLIVLITYQDNLLQFEFDENANVGELKRKLEERTGLARNRQHIIWNTGADEDITDDVCWSLYSCCLLNSFSPFRFHWALWALKYVSSSYSSFE